MRKLFIKEEIKDISEKTIYCHNIVIIGIKGSLSIRIWFSIYSFKESIYSIEDIDMLLKISIGANISHINTFSSKKEVGIITGYNNNTISFYNILTNEEDDYVSIPQDTVFTVYDYKRAL